MSTHPSLIQAIAQRLAAYPRTVLVVALIYLVSPIDLLPESFLGPLGFLDDLLVILIPILLNREARRLKDQKRKPPTDDVIDTTIE
jgi:uncharacterized membrane protein YkvA (DUF1232 family)